MLKTLRRYSTELLWHVGLVSEESLELVSHVLNGLVSKKPTVPGTISIRWQSRIPKGMMATMDCDGNVPMLLEYRKKETGLGK